MIRLSIIIPCYNEEKRFSDGFSHYYKYLKKQKFNWELIFVNDGSSDHTLRLLENVRQKDKNIKVINYKKNRGKGFAISQGFKKAKGNSVLFADIDYSVPISTVNSFLELSKDSKVIIGSRRVKGSKLMVRQHPFREFLGKGFTLLVRLFVDISIKDATCGFKMFDSEIGKKIFKKITVYRWAFDAELIYLCKKYNIEITQEPVIWSDKSGSKVSLKKDIVPSLVGLTKIRLNDIQGKY